MSDYGNQGNPRLSKAPESEEDLRALLRAAGPRPPVPADDLAAIAAAAREEWRRVVTARRAARRRARAPLALALAASLLLALGAAWWWRGRTPAAAARHAASLELVRGEVRLAGAESSEAAGPAPGQDLPVGARVETLGAGSRAALRLASGHSVRLAAATRVRLAAAGRVELARGTLYVDSGGAAAGAVEVVTSVGVVRDVGTQFEVQVAGGETAELRVRVREGAVSLSNGGTHEATAGEELRLAAGGALTRGSVPRAGELWSWVQEAAPSLDIEGATLTAFLDWVARETGLEVGFASAAAARAAAGVVLHGTIEGLTPEESLSVVLPGSGYSWTVVDGRLEIGEEASG